MLELIDYQRSINSLRIKWSKTDYWGKYFFLVFWIIGVVISIVVFKDDGLIFEILLPTSLLLAISSFIAIQSNDKFEEALLNRPASDLKMSIKKEMMQSGWAVYRCNDKYLIADKHSKWITGSKATILFHKNKALINVQNLYGFRGYFPFSFGRNKKIREMLIELIETSQMEKAD